MNGTALSELISRRRTILSQLLEIGGRQMEVIAAGRMTELMGLLAEKQQPLQQLGEISTLLREAAQDDPQARQWESAESREKCRVQQQQCEQMHIELLAIEAQCETALSESRESLQQRLGQIDSANQAANKYVDSEAIPTLGNRLDLSSD